MILIALGSNLGDASAQLADARARMQQQGIRVVKASSVLVTAAMLPPNAPPEWNMDYANQVVAVETALAPPDLLIALKQIEQAMGRIDRGRWGPREIDLDLLAYDAVVMQSEALTVPHAGIAARAFVLKPLAEIAAGWRHPITGKTAAAMLAELGA